MATLCACSGSETGGSGTSSSGGGNGTTTSGSGGGSGTTTGSGGGGGSAPVACGSAALCGGIYLPSSCDAFGTGSGSGGGSPSAATVTEMRCALTKLRDHEVGYVSLFVEATTNTGCGIRTEIVSFGDGSASVQDIHWADIGVTPGTPERVTLETKDYFDTCLAGSDDKLAECVLAMTTKTAVTGPTCPCRGVPGAQDGQCKSPF